MESIRRLLLLRNALWSATSPLARQLFDVCATAVIVTIAAAMGAQTFYTSLAKAEASEAMTLASSATMEAVLIHAETGRWPAARIMDGEDEAAGKYTDRIELGEGGRVHISFTADAHRLVRDRHLTAAPVPGGDGATLRWQLTDDDTVAGEPINPLLIPYAWRLDKKEH